MTTPAGRHQKKIYEEFRTGCYEEQNKKYELWNTSFLFLKKDDGNGPILYLKRNVGKNE